MWVSLLNESNFDGSRGRCSDKELLHRATIPTDRTKQTLVSVFFVALFYFTLRSHVGMVKWEVPSLWQM